MKYELPPLPEGMKKEDYWFVMPLGVSWHFLIQELLRSLADVVKKYEKDNPVMVLVRKEDQKSIYMFKKHFVKAEELSRMTGLTVKAVNDTPIIVLDETKPAGVPDPNVDYWGRG